jgi:hypothetical protein
MLWQCQRHDALSGNGLNATASRLYYISPDRWLMGSLSHLMQLHDHHVPSSRPGNGRPLPSGPHGPDRGPWGPAARRWGENGYGGGGYRATDGKVMDDTD